jgi:ribosomal protein S18 acetylase RimI-like enzyme
VTRTVSRPRLRPLGSADRKQIEYIVRAVGIFRDDEITVALEVFDSSCRLWQTDYHTLGADVDGRLAGWICWGATPCTVGTYDLYWMAVDPSVQGVGVGTALIEEMERRLAGEARLVAIDTSGREDYARTRRFYQARGYQIAGVIPDFYAPGDDQVILTKVVGGRV